MNSNPISSCHVPDLEDEPATGVLQLSIQEYGIGMVFPPRAEFEGTSKLDCGAVIYGTYRGTLECRRGAVIIAQGGKFFGRLTAERIIVVGKVGDVTIAAKDSALLIASEELTIGAGADIHAVLRAPSFAIPPGANMNSSVMKSMLGAGHG
ncbi:MAG: polymer-forming cytoskeletal protein [Proteobacteria bacterium]|nr:polymer-forming cytoskeletal protein [Pseudomonadota bacterium]